MIHVHPSCSHRDGQWNEMVRRRTGKSVSCVRFDSGQLFGIAGFYDVSQLVRKLGTKRVSRSEWVEGSETEIMYYVPARYDEHASVP